MGFANFPGFPEFRGSLRPPPPISSGILSPPLRSPPSVGSPVAHAERGDQSSRPADSDRQLERKAKAESKMTSRKREFARARPVDHEGMGGILVDGPGEVKPNIRHMRSGDSTGSERLRRTAEREPSKVLTEPVVGRFSGGDEDWGAEL